MKLTCICILAGSSGCFTLYAKRFRRFSVGGTRYRLIVSFNYERGAAYIKFFGSHAQYDRVDAATVDTTGVIHGKAKS